MQGSDNADIWRFERDQCRKQLADRDIEIERLRAALTEIAEFDRDRQVLSSVELARIAQRALEP